MSTLVHFTTIEDAYYYFFEAKGMADTPQGIAVKQRHLRAAVFLGWVAVDDAVAAFAVREHLVWPRNCRGLSLFPKLRFIWSLLDSAGPDEGQFVRLRAIRNGITHPSGVADILPTLEEADELLTYCKELIRVMYPHLVVGEEWKGRLFGNR
jgi:hypothetical protein